jgi:hypothetical protein
MIGFHSLMEAAMPLFSSFGVSLRRALSRVMAIPQRPRLPALLLLAVIVAPAHAELVDTFNESYSVGYPFYSRNSQDPESQNPPVHSAVIGQTFTVGADNRLEGFSFLLYGQGKVATRGFVYEWNGDRLGRQMFAGDAVTPVSDTSAMEFQLPTFDGNALALESGRQYAILLSVFGRANDEDALLFMPLTGSAEAAGVYDGGHLLLSNATDLFALEQDNLTCSDCARYDAMVRVLLSPAPGSTDIPEPATLGLTGLGAIVLGLTGRASRKTRRRRGDVTPAMR